MKFVARDSVYLSGSVKPALEVVEITVLNDETREVIVTGLTDCTFASCYPNVCTFKRTIPKLCWFFIVLLFLSSISFLSVFSIWPL